MAYDRDCVGTPLRLMIILTKNKDSVGNPTHQYNDVRKTNTLYKCFQETDNLYNKCFGKPIMMFISPTIQYSINGIVDVNDVQETNTLYNKCFSGNQS